MKRLPLVITAALLLLVSPFSKAQEQRGIVKTRGRMVNGKLVHGEGIPGTLVSIQGRNTIRVQNKSEFFSNLYLKFLRHRFGLGRAATFWGDGLFL